RGPHRHPGARERAAREGVRRPPAAPRAGESRRVERAPRHLGARTGHPSVLVAPLGPLDALGYVRAWLEQPSVRIIEPGPRHVDLLSDLFGSTGVAGSLTSDTRVP